ncbi:helix-turn-helix domain-containing protein [Paenibacillus sp. LHD-117]|uniref:response regulator transcription factor n=1 Tax=Paenibacillus sp. LHD-117 TaxID=3071412 RepID=UPI0027DF8B43|nr:helix-turn-helix domain-containing protein [Paenibacillus sp. LHD-117]MDQ6417863.1 helix-turn-helix domain-containing protein [Paenibacillus sp. LHD-117]
MHKVLLIDPNHHSRIRVQSMLNWNSLNLTLEHVSNSHDDIIPLISNHHYLIVLISIQGADAEGIDLCGMIREKLNAPIILIGGSQDFRLAKKAMYYQVHDYLPEPVFSHQLTASLQSAKEKIGINLPTTTRLTNLNHSSKLPTSPNKVIEKVKEYLEYTKYRNITLKEISSIMHFNSSYLGQLFKEHVNMTFNEYLLQQRMEKAKYLLEHTDMKVYEIACEIGYSEMDWFYKKFKLHTGLSANEYRKIFSITA